MHIFTVAFLDIWLPPLLVWLGFSVLIRHKKLGETLHSNRSGIIITLHYPIPNTRNYRHYTNRVNGFQASSQAAEVKELCSLLRFHKSPHRKQGYVTVLVTPRDGSCNIIIMMNYNPFKMSSQNQRRAWVANDHDDTKSTLRTPHSMRKFKDATVRLWTTSLPFYRIAHLAL